MKKLLISCVLMTGTAFGQSSVRFDSNVTTTASNVPINASAAVLTVPNAVVTVCAYPPVGIPCTNTVPIFQDQALTNPIDNPLTTDPKGRFGFWLTPGQYSYSVQNVSGQNVGNYPLSLLQGIGPTLITPARGGFGLDLSSSSGCGLLTAGVWTVNQANCPNSSWSNPLSFGLISNGSTATVTASGAAGAITLSAASDFVAMQGVMIAHAGNPCGSVKGGGCASPPAPAVTNAGTAGSTTYLYRLACIDGLGGVGVAGTAAGTATGNATLAGIRTGTVLSGNYNVVRWTGNSTCFEVAIYRNGALIATEYSAPSGTMTYNDMGLAASYGATFPSGPPVWVSRDIPSAPLTAELNDNYIGIIQTLAGTSATISPSLGASITAATLYHSDTPLIQAAITSSPFVTLPPLKFLVNYPINYTNVGHGVNFDVNGMINGPAEIFCDTGDICLDITGDNNIELANFSMAFGTLNPSTISIYCSRDATTHSDVAQEITTRKINMQTGASPALGGRGSVGFYNHACEIQHNFDTQLSAVRGVVLTATNIDHVSSPFDAHDDRGTNSMSEVEFFASSGGAQVAAELDNAFTISFYGGFNNDNFDPMHPWAIEVDPGETGRLIISGMRFEGHGGLIDVAANAQLQEPTINVDLYRVATLLPNTPQIRLNGAALLANAPLVLIDDYGGSGPSTTALVDGDPGCGVGASHLQLGIFETLGTCRTSGAANFITGANPGSGDWSMPPSYTIVASATGSSWVKLGTWIFNIGSTGGTTLNVRFSTGAGFDPGNMDKPAIADVTIRTGNNSSAPNISAAALTVSGEGQLPLSALKVVATGGSTSVTNASWDVYVNYAVFATGSYQVYKAPADQWINISTLATDPGTGPTIIPGTLYHAPMMTTSTPTGTCTLKGFIPTVLNGTTVNVAICN